MSKGKRKRQTDLTKPFDKWNDLNAVVVSIDSESVLKSMLDVESDGPNRTSFMLRIHSRLNKIRADRERMEIQHGKAQG